MGTPKQKADRIRMKPLAIFYDLLALSGGILAIGLVFIGLICLWGWIKGAK